MNRFSHHQNVSQADALFQKAFAAHNAGDMAKAEELYRKALRKAPSDMETLYLLGTVCSQQGKRDEAAKYLGKALEIDPRHPEALNNMGLTLMSQRKREEAAKYYRRALEARPDYADAHSNLGHTLEVMGELDEAEQHLRRALELAPNHANVYYNLGLVLLRRDRFEEAARCFTRGLELKPDLAAAYNDLGSIYKIWGRMEPALACFQRAVELEPNAFFSRNNLGAVYEELGRFDEALVEYERAAELQPADPTAKWNMAYLFLRQGILDRGWEAHEIRTTMGHVNDRFPYTNWDGSSLEGKTLLVMAEQGLGDEIFFASCVPDVIRQAGHVVVECDPRLQPLFARSFPNATIQGSTRLNIGWIVDVPKIDMQVAAGSIPRFVRRTLESFPKEPGYVVADSQRVEYWRSRLATLGPELKVGICWRSGLRKGERLKQYSELSQWKDIFAVPGVRFVKLQYDECEEELAEAEALFGVKIERFSELDMKNELDETCALITALDVVITAGTAVSEMAGALGVEVYRLDVQGKQMDSLGTDHSPWHPAMRLFKQMTIGDWSTPLALVAEALKDKVQGTVQTTEFVRLPSGVEIAVDGSLDDMSTYVLKEKQGWFEAEYAFVPRLVGSGSCVIEIGAGVGAYALPLAARLVEGELYAYTQASAEIGLLMRSRARNRFEHRMTVAIAAQDWSIDEEMNRHGFDGVDLVRIAASACDSALLAGATQFLDARSPLIMFGVRAGEQFDVAVTEALAAHGYGLYRLIPGLQLLVPVASTAELDAFTSNLFACKSDRAQVLEANGVLLRQTPSLGELPGVDQPYWLDLLRAHPYAAGRVEEWAVSMRGLPGWEVYWMALNLYAMAQRGSDAAVRYASLQAAHAVLNALMKEQATLPRLAGLCRVLCDMGRREAAVQLLNQICQLLQSGAVAQLNEPCIALDDAFASMQPAGREAQWFVAMVLAERENLRAFSDFFTGKEALPVWQEVSGLGFGNEEIARRITLINARCA